MDSPRPVLVTGGSRGIGAAIVLELARAGHDVWLNYHSNTARAEAVAAEVAGLGRRCRLLPFDVADEAAATAALAPLLAVQAPFALVHNAGITQDALAASMTREQWDRVLAVHLTGFYILTRLVLKPMIGARGGRIVAISSISGQTGESGQMNYSAAKAGLIGAAKALAREMGRCGILVNAVAPGIITTEMTSNLPLDKLKPLIPLRRAGTPEEVAGVVGFLLGPKAGYITGQVIAVNGGLYM
jgi:3-oxoacyl-[acyl-carrier protein] reductase